MNFWGFSVINKGRPIPANDFNKLFQPFHREQSSASRNGLSLGLYIASEVAKSHSGTMEVISDDAQTCFTFRVEMKGRINRSDAATTS